jgi:hypothetical protein
VGAIVALDIATTMGWALLDDRTPERPFLGSIKFPSDPDEVGRAAENMRKFLADRHAMHGGLLHIVFEAQHVAGTKKTTLPDGSKVETGGMNMKVLARLLGLAAMAEWFAHVVGAKCYKVEIATWRKHAFGNGRMKRQESKERAMEECRALGFDPPNHDAAEAFFILDYYISLRNRNGAGIAMPWRDNAFFNRQGLIR